MRYSDDRQIVANVFRPTRELFERFQRHADDASIGRLSRELDGLERELLAAYFLRNVVEAQAIRRELSDLKANLVKRLEEAAFAKKLY